MSSDSERIVCFLLSFAWCGWRAVLLCALLCIFFCFPLVWLQVNPFPSSCFFFLPRRAFWPSAALGAESNGPSSIFSIILLHTSLAPIILHCFFSACMRLHRNVSSFVCFFYWNFPPTFFFLSQLIKKKSQCDLFFSKKKPEKDIVCNAAGGQENLFVAMRTN